MKPCRFDFHDFAPGRAGANPAPRGVGARGWRRICSPDLFLSPTPPDPTSVSAGFVFSKTEYWDQLPSLSSESKREASHGALFAPGLSLWIFSRDTLFCLYNEVSYPDPHAPSRYRCRHGQIGMWRTHRRISWEWSGGRSWPITKAKGKAAA